MINPFRQGRVLVFARVGVTGHRVTGHRGRDYRGRDYRGRAHRAGIAGQELGHTAWVSADPAVVRDMRREPNCSIVESSGLRADRA